MANVFDSSFKALWRHESGAMNADSKGTNTLINDGVDVAAGAGDFKEGAASGLYVLSGVDHQRILDTNLDSGFPLKSGESNRDISVVTWVRLTSHPSGSALFSKFSTVAGKRSFEVIVNASEKILVSTGTGTGSTSDFLVDTSAVTLGNGTWYHVGATYENSTGNIRIRVWDEDGGVVGETTGTVASGIWIADTQVGVGIRAEIALSLDGNLDEMAISDRVLTPQEIDQIRNGTFGATTGTFVDNITGDNGDDETYGIEGTGKNEGQTFTPTETFDLSSVKLKLYRTGNPANLTVQIRTTAGGTPTDTVLATGMIDADSITASSPGEFYEIVMTPFELQAATLYAIVLVTGAGDSSNKVNSRKKDGGSSYGQGKKQAKDGAGAWTSQNDEDLMFEVLGLGEPTATGSIIIGGMSGGMQELTGGMN